MELARGLHVVDGITAPSGVSLNPLALFGNDGSVTLVDCGFPGQSTLTIDYLASLGTSPSKVKNLILTHYDPDHVGSAAELQRLTGCTIMAPEFDARVIAGEKFTADQLRELFPHYGEEELAALQVRLHPDPEYENVKVDK
ncbi:MAG: MBL fold metallo-hydrolase, partial [Nitrososphaerales archaeon]